MQQSCELTVGLLVTYRCNLSCRYCYIARKQDKDMTLETAQGILTPILSRPGGPVDIALLGAEPLMAEGMVRALVEWAEEGQWNRRFQFFGSTNGTLLTEDTKEWLTRHSASITLGLSYDGVPSRQRANRGANAVDLDFFLRTWPEQTVQMTVNAVSAGDVAKGVIALQEKGFRVNLSVAYEARDWDEAALRTYERQLSRLADYYLTHPEKPRIYSFLHDIPGYAYNLTHPAAQERSCGAGDGFTVYDVDGQRYPCHMLSPLALDQAELRRLKELDFWSIRDFSDPGCQGCPYTSACPTCAGCNFIYRGSPVRRDSTHCRIMKLEVLAAMRYEALRLSRKIRLSADDVLLVDALAALRRWQKTQEPKQTPPAEER